MKTILPNISEWSWFSEEKQLNFNGHLLAVGEHRILVDPPPMNASDRAITQRGGALDYIILTNRDHEREAANFRKSFNCQVMAPELDAKEMTLPIDKTFKDGELLPGGIWVVQLSYQKSPGESALFLQQGQGVLIVGDGIIGDPPGSLRLLPSEKYIDIVQARDSLRRLLKYTFDSLLVGDGTSLLTGAKPALEQLLANK
jgi:glyoxylase-like metal-dependent hydrolase (beta-lactamase superfamily II)